MEINNSPKNQRKRKLFDLYLLKPLVNIHTKLIMYLKNLITLKNVLDTLRIN